MNKIKSNIGLIIYSLILFLFPIIVETGLYFLTCNVTNFKWNFTEFLKALFSTMKTYITFYGTTFTIFITVYSFNQKQKQLAEDRIKEQEKRDAVRGVWDRINLETDVVPYLRGYFHTDDMTTISGKRVSGRPFIRYRLNVVGDFVFTYTSTFVETEFLVNPEYHDFSKLSSILESWAAVENLQYNLEEANKRLAPCGARLYGSYGILDNTLRLKVEDTQYGTDCGFENRIFVKYGNKVDAYICNRLLNLSGLEEIITSLAEKLNTNIPPLVEVLK